MSARHAQAHAHVDLGMDNQKDQEDLKKNPNTQNVRMKNAKMLNISL